MGRKLVITLDEVTTQKYLDLARQQTKALVDEDCEPSDVMLAISISANPAYGHAVFIDEREIGEASVDWTR